jgi:hypothetical protein
MIAEMQKLVEQYLNSDPESIIAGKEPEELVTLVANKGRCYRSVMEAFYFDSSILRWWSVNSDRKELYPLHQMARNVLATPAAAVACEAAFSSGRDLISFRRSRMKPETITRSMICKHFHRATLEEDVEPQQQINENINDALHQKQQAMDMIASQFDIMVNKEREARRRKQRKKALGRNDLASHRSLTEGTEGSQVSMRKSLAEIEHDGDVEFNKPLPDLPEKKFTKAQPILPHAAGTEEEHPAELEPVRIAQKLPSVTWDAISDLSASDSEEESERRDRQRRREKELQNRNKGVQKALCIRSKGSHRQRNVKGKEPATRRANDDIPKSPRVTTPKRAR